MKEQTIAAIAVVAVVAIFAYMAGTGQIVSPLQISPSQPSGTSISSIFHGQIDPYSPDLIHNNNVACVANSGTWFDQADKVGCFSIPPGGFDSTLCTSAALTVFRNICESVDDADWVCESTQVGCSY